MSRIIKKAGRVEVHIPQQFTCDRPAVHFTRAEHVSSVVEHPLYGTLPKDTTFPYVLDIPEKHCRELSGPEAPKGFHDFDTTDRPALSLHVITFSDCTFVTLTYLHCLTDGMGRRELVVNWSRVLRGDKNSVSPVAGPVNDPAAQISSMQKSGLDEDYLWQHKMLSGFSLLLFFCYFLGDILFGPRNRQRTVVVPAAFVACLREEAYKDGSCLTLSDGDILTAWLVRLTCSHIPSSSRRSLAIGSAIDPRGRVPASIIDPNTAYISNLVVHAWTLTTANEFLGQSLGHAATLFRESVGQHLKKPQLLAMMKLWYKSHAKSGIIPVYTEPGSFLLTVSNVSKANFQDAIDFEPAVISTGLDSQPTSTPRGRPVWNINMSHPQLALPGVVHIQGKDHDGNYWVLLSTNNKAWEKLRQISFSRSLL